MSLLDLLHDRCRPSCHYHTERKNKNHAWTLLQGPSAAVSGRVQPGDVPPSHTTGLVSREAHCTSARGPEAGAEGLRAGTHFGGVVVSPGGLCRLTGVCSADPLPLLPEADSAPLHGRGTMWWEVGKCRCSGVKGDIRSAPLEDTIPSGHQK